MGNALDLRFLTDEDVPRSTAKILRESGYDAVDVRDVGLRGKSGSKFGRRTVASSSNNRNWQSEITGTVRISLLEDDHNLEISGNLPSSISCLGEVLQASA
jgi:hypothetical protein